jgi:pyruvate formate lyase activating enzyme
MKNSGIVFNIQKYSVHDGPGIRTVVFLKGCPLRCRWCSNPESQKLQPQVAYNRNKCLTLDHCVRCLEVCTAGAIKAGAENRVQIDRDICTECLLCAQACPARALSVYGETMTVAPEFAVALLTEARRRRINTAMESCGFCSWEALEKACGVLDTLLYDVKSMDPEKHRVFTGVSNELILDNLRRAREAFPGLAIWVRTPIVPGFNDSVEDIRPILKHIEAMPDVCFEALDYHRMGKPKYEYLGLEFPMGDRKLDEERIRRIHAMIRSEFPHLRSPGMGENGKPQKAASQG